MSVLDEDFIAEQNITDFRDVSLHVPNAHIDTNTHFPNISIRGFGTDLSNNMAFEQPVGLVLDGVPYSKRAYWLGPIFDIERVEVLRGPQGTLFGKNTTAGLVNVVTKQPTDQFTGYFNTELGELNRRRFAAGIGGPLVPGLLNFRIAGLTEERDGFVRNTTTAVVPEAPRRMNARDRKALRSQLAVPEIAGGAVDITYQHSEFAAINAGAWELRDRKHWFVDVARMYDPNTDIDPSNWVASLGSPAFLGAKFDSVSVSGDYNLGAWRLDSQAAYSLLQNRNDVQLSFAPQMGLLGEIPYTQQKLFSELHLESPELSGIFGLQNILGFALAGSSDFLVGLFVQNRKIFDSHQRILFNVPVVEQMAASDAAQEAQPCPHCDPNPERSEFEQGISFFRPTSNSLAGFLNASYRPAPSWELQYGMRLTSERKRADWRSDFKGGPTDGEVAKALLDGNEMTDSAKLSVFAFTPQVSLNYDWTENIGMYAKWAQGFKSAGFNQSVFGDVPENAKTFDTETMEAWEFGAKTVLPIGLNADLALFRMKALDMQVFTVDTRGSGFPVFFTENAGEAVSQGAELDLLWQPAPWLTLRDSLGFNDTEFLEFPLGFCAADRPNTDGDDDPRCDHSGKVFPFAPKWTNTATLRGNLPLNTVGWLERGSGLLDQTQLVGGLQWEFQSARFLSETLDPRTREPSFLRLRADLGLRNDRQGWSAKLVGTNLTDAHVPRRALESALGPGTFLHVAAPPRLFFGSVRWEF